MLDVRTAAVALFLSTTAMTGCDVLGSERIGEEGGIVVSADGRMALEIPAGALDQAVEITMEALAGPDGAASELYVMEPVGLTFSRPVVITYDYDARTLGEGEPESLTMVTHRELGWDYLSDHVVDDEDQVLSASIMALSPVVVIREQ